MQPEQTSFASTAHAIVWPRKVPWEHLIPILGTFRCCLAMVPPPLLQAEFPLSHDCLQCQQHEELKQWGSEASAPERGSGRQAHTKTETKLFSISSVSTTTKKPPLHKNPVFPFIHSFYIHHCCIISHLVLHHPYGNPSSWYLL